MGDWDSGHWISPNLTLPFLSFYFSLLRFPQTCNQLSLFVFLSSLLNHHYNFETKTVLAPSLGFWVLTRGIGGRRSEHIHPVSEVPIGDCGTQGREESGRWRPGCPQLRLWWESSSDHTHCVGCTQSRGQGSERLRAAGCKRRKAGEIRKPEKARNWRQARLCLGTDVDRRPAARCPPCPALLLALAT